MRTEAELKAAADLIEWYWASGRVQWQDYETYQNIMGVTAAVEWVLGADKPNPVAGMLADVAAMRAGPERN